MTDEGLWDGNVKAGAALPTAGMGLRESRRGTNKTSTTTTSNISTIRNINPPARAASERILYENPSLRSVSPAKISAIEYYGVLRLTPRRYHTCLKLKLMV